MDTRAYTRLRTRLEQRLADSLTEKRAVRIIATSAAMLAVALPILQLIEINRLLDPSEPSLWGVIISYTSFWLRVRIGAALAVNAVAIWPFKPKGFFVSTLAMSWAVVEYVLWLSWSLRVKESLGIGRLPESSTFGLYTANLLDVIVLGFALLVFSWIVKKLASILPITRGD